MLFTRWDRFTRFLASILIAVPIWVANALLIFFSPEFAQTLGVTGPISAGNAVVLFYGGLVVGDVASGVISQVLGSRRKVVLLFLSMLVVAYGLYFLLGRGASPARFFALCGLLGVTSGYWAIFATVAAEQFGTNIRATVATTVPNFVRGLVVVVTLSFSFLKPRLGLAGAALAVGAFWFVLAIVGALRLRETFGGGPRLRRGAIREPMSLYVVDVEADGPIPGKYSMVSLGAVLVEPGARPHLLRAHAPHLGRLGARGARHLRRHPRGAPALRRAGGGDGGVRALGAGDVDAGSRSSSPTTSPSTGSS